MLSADNEILKNYISAQGPDGLKQALENILEKSQQDSNYAAQEHFIYYQVGEQKSLIKVDMSERPTLFWYFDLLGRPATKIVKKIISDFLWEKCGEKESYLQELEFKE